MNEVDSLVKHAAVNYGTAGANIAKVRGLGNCIGVISCQQMSSGSSILADLNAKTIDHDEDPEIGDLVEVKLPDLPNKAKFLRVRCGTGREFAIGIPPHINNALDAQAWCVGLETKDFTAPEVRA